MAAAATSPTHTATGIRTAAATENGGLQRRHLRAIQTGLFLLAVSIYATAYRRAGILQLRATEQRVKIVVDAEQPLAREFVHVRSSGETGDTQAGDAKTPAGEPLAAEGHLQSARDDMPPISAHTGTLAGAAETQGKKEEKNGSSAVDSVRIEYRGCIQIEPTELMYQPTRDGLRMTPASCARHCFDLGMPWVLLTGGEICGCAALLSREDTSEPRERDANKCNMGCTGSKSIMCGGHAWWVDAYAIVSPIPEVITVYVAPAKRTSSLYATGRFERYYSDKYLYVTKMLNNQVLRTVDIFYEEVCVRHPGKKVFVQIAGAVKFVMENFPERSALVLTGDEIGNWGLTHQGHAMGPHGDGEPFDTAENSAHGHILLPPHIRPFFKQYYDWKQAEAFGSDMEFIPLGSRSEFPDIDPNSFKAASRRQYLFSYMVALTDAKRYKVHQLLLNATEVPEAKKFIHVSQNWHGSANNDEYVSPSEYGRIMQESAFAICPKGHNVEQFRIYEAIEAGAIPILSHDEGFLKNHMPPEYLASPMLILDRWEDLVDVMVGLSKDPRALDKRQADLKKWYDDYMRGRARRIEEVLEAHEDVGNGFCAKYRAAHGL